MLEDWPIVERVIHRWRKRIFRDEPFNLDSWIQFVLRDKGGPNEGVTTFDQIVDEVVAKAGGLTQGRPREGAALLAGLGVVGPEVTGAPPVAIWEALHAKIPEVRYPDQDWSCLELAIACGCGWNGCDQPRREPARSSAWLKDWDGAILAFRFLVYEGMESLLYFLERRVNHFPKVTSDRLQQAWMDADVIGLQLIRGKCECGHHVAPCRQGNKCGRFCCDPKHDLSHWCPSRQSLRGFIRQAIRGNAGGAFLPGAFVYSAAFPFLRTADNLQAIPPVEFWRCHACGQEYEGSHCPECDTLPDVRRTLRFARHNWLYVPYGTDEIIYYKQEDRWKCTSETCRNLHAQPQKKCFLCGSQVSGREMKVVVYQGEPWSVADVRRLQADDPEDDYLTDEVDDLENLLEEENDDDDPIA